MRGALPGEVVRARVVKDKGSYWHADLVEVLEASPHRRPSLCPVAEADDSGCCDLAFLDPEAARALKVQIAAEQLARLGGVEWAAVSAADGEPRAESLGAPTGWRTRLRLAVDQSGRAGFHRYHSTELAAGLDCPQPVAGALDGLAERRFPAGSELFVVVDDEGERHIQLVGRRPGRRGLEVRDIEGSGLAAQRVGERVWRLPVRAFWQPHREAARRYSELVSQWAGDLPGAVALDLYGGAGVFASALARAVGPAGRVLTVDSEGASSRSAVRALADLPQVEVLSGSTAKLLPDLPAAQVAVVDPPRAGAGRAVVAALAGTDRIIHIGCETAAFSRDVGLYVEHGFAVREIRVFDAFPLTHHMECFALLER